nr:peptidylprolyl isomerase [Pseudoalteromonas viridis]
MLLLTLTACQSSPEQANADKTSSALTGLSPADIIAQASESDWRTVEPEQILKITLPGGPVYVELNPELAPGHVSNIKALAREGFYQGLSIYRFVEGFVAQGGTKMIRSALSMVKKPSLASFIWKRPSLWRSPA